MVVLVIHASTALNVAAMAYGWLLVLLGSEPLLGHERWLSLPFQLSFARNG